MTEMKLKEGLDAMEVAAYLRRHPAFLKDFPDLAMHLQVPREQGPAASLAGYQLETLRASNAAQTRRLAELVEIAGENEQLMVQVHSLNLTLMRASTLEQTVRSVVGGLTEDFGTDLVRLVLFARHESLPHAEWLVQRDGGAAAWPEFTDFLKRHEPLCGRLSADKLIALFGDSAADVRSVALMRLGHSGMLAIGSLEANRFHPGIGTIFLKLIAEAVTAALLRFRDDDA
ncbi:MAG TPA: DUF484 family protein [Rhodanobacteraceae bacterium]|nr:DUF484 family protein [Rhodanobacteraceae bacterium]